MIVSDYRSAVTSFEQACQLLDSCYGPGSTECGEAYLQYGIALFELARLEEGTDGGVVNVESRLFDILFTITKLTLLIIRSNLI